MKVLTLLAFLASVYTKEVVDQGYISDPSQLPPGYVLQPDGSYLKTDEEVVDEAPKLEDGWVLQPDGSYLKTIEDPGTVEYEDEIYPQFSKGLLTIGEGKNAGYFKVTRGSKNENDFSVETVYSASDPTPLISTIADAPQVYQDGTRGQDDYQITLGVGKGANRGYLRMKPDSSKSSGFRFIPQYITGYSEEQDQTKTNAKAPAPQEEEEEEIPDSPEIVSKKGYSVIVVGRPSCRRYVKLTPSKTNNPNDFDLKPIKHPDQPNSSPDPTDDDAPEIFENGKRGTPEYQPIIASGPSANRRYISIAVDPKRPKRFTFIPAPPLEKTSQVETEPNEDEIEYEDVPENPQYKTVTVPGNKIPVGIVSLGNVAHRCHFKIVRRSNKPGDVEVKTIRDPNNLNSTPDPKNEYTPEVVQQGDPSDEKNAPVVATGPRFKRVFHRMLITKKGLRLLPCRKQLIKGTKRYQYLLNKRRWHYRTVVIRKPDAPRPQPKFVKKIITTYTQVSRPKGFFENIFGSIIDVFKKPPPPRVVVQPKIVTTQINTGTVQTGAIKKIITTHVVEKPKPAFFIGALFG
uniref:Mid MW proline-rich protein n=1 Tax=Euperipatoides rowelli TaxID=49087 RepID=D9IX72_EUPRO|nr:mid MW proline-rich protein [Euperipatoides rowelli]